MTNKSIVAITPVCNFLANKQLLVRGLMVSGSTGRSDCEMVKFKVLREGTKTSTGEKVLKASKNIMLLLDIVALTVGNAANNHSL